MNRLLRLTPLRGLAMVLLFVAVCGRPENRAPDFMLSDSNGNRFYLSGQRGTIVLLNFWSASCIPCLKEMPELQALADSFAHKRVLVVGICNDPGEAGYVPTLLNGLKVVYANLNDESKKKYQVCTKCPVFRLRLS